MSTSCWKPWCCEHRDGFWLVFFSSVVAVCWMLLPTSRCGQGFLPVARSSDPDIVPCIDGDDGASCAEVGWRVCLCSACLTGPNGVIRLSLFLLALVEIRGRFCAWAFPAWHAGPRVVRELILFLSLPALCSVVSCPSFQVAFSLSPCSWGHIWNFRALVRFVGPCCCFFFGVSASRVKSKRGIRLWYLFQCFRFQRPCAWSVVSRPVPLLSPAVASVGATSVLLRNVWRCLPRILLNAGIERVSLCWLIGTINSCSTLGCISHALALSYFGMVAVAVSSCYCLRGWRLW